MTAEDALNVLGIRTAKETIDVIVNRTLYTARNPTYQPALKALWQHGVACAHASRLVAERAELTTSGEVFFMGLMHDIGKLLLVQILAKIGGTLPAEETEHVLKQQHGVFGLKLMELWKLPAKYALAARYHDALAEAPKISDELLSVNLGNLLARRAGYGTYDEAQHATEIESATTLLGLDTTSLTRVEEQLKDIMTQVSMSFD